MRAWCATLVSIAAGTAMSSAGAFSQSSVTEPSSDRSDVREVRLVPGPPWLFAGYAAREQPGAKARPSQALSLASSASTIASCSCSSLRASRGLHRPRRTGMLSRKMITPAKQIQYQVCHWPGASAAAFCTSAPCAFRYANTPGGTLDSAVSWAAYGVMVWSCGATAITPLIAALLVLITVRIWTPVAPPPAAATACAASFGGTAAGVG